MSKVQLIIDDRERAIFPYIKTELINQNITIARITTGDYNIVVDGRVAVCLERKTLEDFAASIKDGRHQNKQNMLELRELTGCSLIYIIEGPANPPPGKLFGRMPYRYIESAIFHLIVRDGISIINSASTLNTSQLLERLCKSVGTIKAGAASTNRALSNNVSVITNSPVIIDAPLYNPTNPDEYLLFETKDPIDFLNKFEINIQSEKKIDDVSTTQIVVVPTPAVVVPTPAVVVPTPAVVVPTPAVVVPTVNVPVELTASHARNDIDIVREMWGCFKGLTPHLSEMFIARWSIRDVISKSVSRSDVESMTHSNGKRVNKRVVDSIMYVSGDTEIRILAKLPGISVMSARALTNAAPLRNLLTYSAGALSIISVSPTRKLGMARAQTLLALMNMRI